jgi:hypothetical protein
VNGAGINHRFAPDGGHEPEGRWLEPHENQDGTWKCRLRYTLTYADEQAGLLFVVVAANCAELQELMRDQDERAARLKVPAYKHRASG